MISKATKLRWRRRLRRGRYKIENLSASTEKGIEDNFFRRLNRFAAVRRFVLGWTMLLALLGVGLVIQLQALSPYYQVLAPSRGGIYTEGILGKFTTANPIYATSSVDSAVSRLLFASLMKFNSKNELVGDLAEKVEADERHTTFTVTLKDDIFWHDGTPITAEDVIFTYKLIQSPDAKSPLIANWRSVKLEFIDSKTVSFTLPHPLSSLPQLMTNGILPKHRLENIPPGQLRNANFNTDSPVGSGPFRWDSIQISGQTSESREEQIGLSAYADYHHGPPALDTFIIKAIRDEQNLTNQFKGQQVDAMVGLDSLPEGLKTGSVSEYEFPLNAQMMVFLKTSAEVLSDKSVRQALVHGTNRSEIISGLGYPVIATNGPLLNSHLGFTADLTQLAYDPTVAKQLLEEGGWHEGVDGKRSKDGTELSFRLFSRDSSEHAYITQLLQRQWRDIGVDLQVVLQDDIELQTTIALHNYDALLYGITVGSDPDVYAYWHSSQADARVSSRLNFSEFRSDMADTALEGGRTRADPDIRIPKYRPFLRVWRDEAPAVALYQPRFLYITHRPVYGLNVSTVNTAIDRYSNVNNWRVRTERVTIE